MLEHCTECHHHMRGKLNPAKPSFWRRAETTSVSASAPDLRLRLPGGFTSTGPEEAHSASACAGFLALFLAPVLAATFLAPSALVFDLAFALVFDLAFLSAHQHPRPCSFALAWRSA